jgi:hypothetical protein
MVDDRDDAEPPLKVTLSPHHVWNRAFDEGRRIGSATASAALCNRYGLRSILRRFLASFDRAAGNPCKVATQSRLV